MKKIQSLLVEALFSTKTISIVFNSVKNPSLYQIEKEENTNSNFNQLNVIQPKKQDWIGEVQNHIQSLNVEPSILNYNKNSWEEGLTLNLSKFLLKEIQNEESRKKGISYVYNKEIITFEPIIIDIEPSPEQYIFGFYFPCSNQVVQILVEYENSIDYYKDIQTCLRSFFEVFSKI